LYLYPVLYCEGLIMKNILIAVLIMVAIASLMMNFSSRKEMSGGEKITFATSATFYPNTGEAIGITKYVEALEGLFKHNPAFKGNVDFRTYTRSSMFPNPAAHLEAASTNAIQITYNGPQEIEMLEPAYKVANIPGLFNDFDHFSRAMNSDAWKKVEDRLAAKKGIKIIHWGYDAGVMYIFSRDKIETLSDIEGLRIRYPGGDAWRLGLVGLKTNPIPLPYTEVVTALQTNLIDGLISDFAGGVPYLGLKDYTTHATLVPVSIQPIAVIASAQWWGSLTTAQQVAIDKMFAVLDINHYYDQLTSELIAEWGNSEGLTSVTPVDLDDWRKAMKASAISLVDGIDEALLEAIKDAE